MNEVKINTVSHREIYDQYYPGEYPELPLIEEMWPGASVRVAGAGTIYAEYDSIKVRIFNHGPNYGAPRSHEYKDIYTRSLEGKPLKNWVDQLAMYWGESEVYQKYIDVRTEYEGKMCEYSKRIGELRRIEEVKRDEEINRKRKLVEKAPIDWVRETERLANEAGARRKDKRNARTARNKVWEKRSKELLGVALRRSDFDAFSVLNEIGIQRYINEQG